MSHADSLISVLLVGCGKMGGALLKGWTRQIKSRVVVVDPSPQPDELKTPNVTWHASLEAVGPHFQPNAIVLAVKPQHMVAVLPAYARFKNSVFLSIAAGQPVQHLEKLLGDTPPSLVRVMPNLPASIGQGMSVAFANPRVTPEQRALCTTLLRAGGEVAWVANENLLDPVTALSGSGPAYVFALVETMAAAGEKLGLSPPLALQLARQTVIGSAALLAQSPETPTALRQAVTSPGGTTAAALDHLLSRDGLPELMLRALRAATERAKELAS